MTLKYTNNNWIEAFRHVPRRKIATRVEEETEADDNEEEEIEAINVC
jgi:hypothetical protein